SLCLSHFRTQNRFALLLEMLFVCRISGRKTASHFCWKCFCSAAFPDAKPLHTFAGNAFVLPHFRTQNRFALLLEMLLFCRISGRKTASHFCWKCSRRPPAGARRFQG